MVAMKASFRHRSAVMSAETRASAPAARKASDNALGALGGSSGPLSDHDPLEGAAALDGSRTGAEGADLGQSTEDAVPGTPAAVRWSAASTPLRSQDVGSRQSQAPAAGAISGSEYFSPR